MFRFFPLSAPLASLSLILFLVNPGGSGAAETVPRIRLSYLEERIPEAGTIRRTKVAIDGLGFACQPPNDWKTGVDEEHLTVQFRSLPLSAGFSVTVLPAVTGASPKDLRARLAQDYKDIVIIEEYKAYTRGPEGTAFELRQTLSGRFTTHMIVMYVSVNHRLLELKLAAPEETFEKCRVFWTQFLNSFSIETADSVPAQAPGPLHKNPS